MRRILGVLVAVTLSLAAPATGEIRQWWKFESARMSIRFVFPAHWRVREVSAGTRSFRVTVGPRREHPPLQVRVGPATGADEYDAWAKIMAAHPRSRITTVEVAGTEARQLSYHVDNGGARRSVRLLDGDTLVIFDCELDLVRDGEEACDRLLKSFRFAKREP